MITTRIILTIDYNDDDVNGYHMMTRPLIQICAKVLQTLFDKIPGFSTNFGPKRNLHDISANFRGSYCLDSSVISRINSMETLMSL